MYSVIKNALNQFSLKKKTVGIVEFGRYDSALSCVTSWSELSKTLRKEEGFYGHWGILLCTGC